MKTILVLSGKGGVGKSSTTAQLAMTYYLSGLKVGVLDIDICGPSLPLLFGCMNASVQQSSQGWIPVQVLPGLHVMSIGFLMENKDAPVVWRGPKKQAMITQFIRDVNWSDLDLLLIDTPPGTSDEHLAILEVLSQFPQFEISGSVLVTTPQKMSLEDVRKEYDFCQKLKLPVLGIIENMSLYICPHCENGIELFSKGGGNDLATETKIPLLGQIPLYPPLQRAMENNLLTKEFQNSMTFPLFQEIIQKIAL